MKGLTIAVIVEKIQTRKDNTVAIWLGTQELTPETGGQLLGMMNKLCVAYITEKEAVPQDVIDKVDALDVDLPGKSQSQRLRSVLYVLFTQDAEGFTTFDEYYHSKTEKIIDHLKNKIK